MTAFGRRYFSALLAGAAFTGHRAHAQSALAAPIDADGPTIAVAGPPDSEAARYADMLHTALAAKLVPHRAVRLRYFGGRDGVTGANMFDARALPDGQAALLLPGDATLAWLAGDTRVRFDAVRLLPMMAAVSSGVLCARHDARALAAGGVIRLGCAATVAPSLTVLMALDMLGAHATQVVASPNCLDAARRGEVDAVFARGLDMQGQVDALALAGLRPVYSVGFPQPDLAASPLPGLPDLATALSGTNDVLAAAWRAVAAASLLDVALALPRLCPESSLSRWRGACDRARVSPAIVARVPQNVRLLTGAAADAAFAAVLADAQTQATLHSWMAERLNWRPT